MNTGDTGAPDVRNAAVRLALEHLRNAREAHVIDHDGTAVAFFLSLAANARRLAMTTRTAAYMS